MLTQIDKSGMSNAKKVVELEPSLDEYIDKLAMLKPLCKFVATDDHIVSSWRSFVNEEGKKDRKIFEYLSYVSVYQDGEHLGDIGVEEVYRKNEGGYCGVYFVKSFRVEKSRGRDNTTFSKHLKVVLRTANKVFIPRADEELISQISSHVNYQVNCLVSNFYNQTRYSIDCDTEAMNYAHLAYKAHLRGESTVTLPSVLATANRRDRDFEKLIGMYDEALKLHDHYNKGNKGFAVQAKLDGSFVVYNYDKNEPDTLCKYNSIDDMPKHLGDKLSALKLLDKCEPVGHIGSKLATNDPNIDYYYLVSGDIMFE